MMEKFQKNDGFTLMELLVTIVTGSIITMAASTVLILGLRIYHRSLETAERQSVMRITTTLLESLSSDGKVEVGDPDEWEIKEVTWVNGGTSERTLVSYSRDFDAIYSGETPSAANDKSPIVEDVTDSSVMAGATILDPSEAPPIYRFKLELQDEEEYDTTVYCRTQDDNWYAANPDFPNEAARKAFLKVLGSQVGNSTRRILDISNNRLEDWYTQWYVETHVDSANSGTSAFKPQGTITDVNDWTPYTPWCATFVSWALNDCSDMIDGAYPQEANVNFLWLEHFLQMEDMDNFDIYDANSVHVPTPGDLVFFTDVEETAGENLTALKDLTNHKNQKGWDLDDLRDAMAYENEQWYVLKADPSNKVKWITSAYWKLQNAGTQQLYESYSVIKHFLGGSGDGLDHVGVVVKVEGDYVYTVEGNVGETVDASYVAIRKYPLTNPTNYMNGQEPLRIFGYATINWK